MAWKQDPEYRREYYRKNKERTLAVNRAWREANKDRHDEYLSDWYDANRDRIQEARGTDEARKAKSEYNREYRKNNPEKIRDANRRRRALKLGANAVPYTTQDVVDTYGLNCYWCGVLCNRYGPAHNSGLPGWETSLHVDHVILLFHGGDDTLENVRPACAKCNLKRGKKKRVG